MQLNNNHLFNNPHLNNWYTTIIKNLDEFHSCKDSNTRNEKFNNIYDQIENIRVIADCILQQSEYEIDKNNLDFVINSITEELFSNLEASELELTLDPTILNNLDPVLTSMEIASLPPVGIHRQIGTNDCFAIAALQCILNSPSLTASILKKAKEGGEEGPLWPLGLIIAQYHTAQQQANLTAPFSSQHVRQCSSNVNQTNQQDDSGVFIEEMICATGREIMLNQSTIRADEITTISNIREGMIPLDLANEERDFNQLFNQFLFSPIGTDEENISRILAFAETPPFFVVNAHRYKQNAGEFLRIGDDIENIPLTLSPDRENTYTLTGCTVHISSENHLNSGHYISLVNKQNNWYLINDKDVYPMDSEDGGVKQSDNNEVQKLLELGTEQVLKQGCQFFYEKMENEEIDLIINHFENQLITDNDAQNIELVDTNSPIEQTSRNLFEDRSVEIAQSERGGFSILSPFRFIYRVVASLFKAIFWN